MATKEAAGPVVGSMEHFREGVIDKLLTGCSVIALVGVPTSLSRIPETGWMPMYAIHVILGSIAVGTFLARGRIPGRVKFAIVITLFYGVGMVGMVNMALVGAGIWWLVVSSLLIGVLYSPRIGLWATLGAFSFVGIVAYLYVNGYLQLTMDANHYVTVWSSWATLVIATTIMPFFVFQAIATLQSETASLLQQVQLQRDEIERLATHDQLTGLLMPKALEDRLEHAIARSHRTGKRLALMFLDLDRFKAVNDTYGHAAGDRVLEVLAERFNTVLRETDSKGRIGGDEFVFVLEQPGNEQQISAIAQRLVDAAADPVVFGDHSLEVGVSIGISLCPEDGSNASSLRRAADAAMYDAKAAGRNGFKFASNPPAQGPLDEAPISVLPKSIPAQR